VQELKAYRDQLYGEITKFDEVTAEVRHYLWENQENRALKSLLDLVRDFRIEERLTRQLLDAANIQGPDSQETEKVRQRVVDIIDSLQAQRDTPTDADIDELSPDWRGRLRDTQQTTLQGTPAVMGEHISLVFVSENAIPFTLRCDKLNISFGQITAVLGRNASGKTTLLRIIAGELRPQLGKLAYGVVGRPNDWYSIKKRIAYVSQTPQSWHGTVGQQLAFEAAATGKRDREVDEAVELSLARFGLFRYRHAGWRSLSPGVVTRFELARAVLRDAMLLVLDEPLAHLDLAGRETFLDDVWRLTRDRNRPLAVIVSSQHIHEVERITDHMMFLDQGQVTIDPVFSSDLSYLELSCSGDLDALRNVLGESASIQARNTSGLYWIKYSKSEKRRIIALLLEFGIEIYYLRDISHSSTRLFE
jgi:ABC-2 type transport system ATP-binding protein